MQKGKLRSKIKKERKSIIVFNAEGKNETEKNYFLNYSSRNIPIKLVYGNATDPKGMLNELIKYCTDVSIDKENGDRAYLLIDMDLNHNKANDVLDIENKCIEYGIEIIYSNPTFEIWFLNHFRYKTSEYMSSKEVVSELKKYINDYSKNLNIFNILKEKTDIAINNSKKLEKYHNENQNNISTYLCNPYIGVYKVIEGIRKIEKLNKEKN